VNRREMLKSTGVIAGAAAVRVAGQEVKPEDQHADRLKIMVTGGHPGDPEYGCGGTIAQLARLGHDVTLLYLNNGEWETSAEIRMAEAKKACEILKARPAYAGQVNGHAIVDDKHYGDFQKIIASENPDAVMTHWMIDNHPDHRAIASLTYEAWKKLNRRFALYYYEVSDGGDTMQFAMPTQYVDITDVLNTKRAACYAHASQNPDFFYDLQDAVARFRGIECGCKRAEAYVRQVGNPLDIFAIAGLQARR
jgi:N-acetylglucosamine malate deacetylase 1